MMGDEARGNDPVSGGDLPQAESQAPPEESPDASQEPKEPNYKEMYLKAKDKVEGYNELERRYRELEDRVQQPPAAASSEDHGQKIQDLLTQAQDYANKGDAAAALALENRAALMQFQQETIDAYTLRDIEDKEERREVANHLQRNRHRLGDAQAARAEVRERKQSKELETLREKLKRAEIKPPTDTVSTSSREVPASQHRVRTMTDAQWHAEQAKLSDNDRMAQQLRLRRGEIAIKD